MSCPERTSQTDPNCPGSYHDSNPDGVGLRGGESRLGCQWTRPCLKRPVLECLSLHTARAITGLNRPWTVRSGTPLPRDPGEEGTGGREVILGRNYLDPP